MQQRVLLIPIRVRARIIVRMLASSSSTSVPILAITVLIRVPIIAITVRVCARRTCARPPALSVGPAGPLQAAVRSPAEARRGGAAPPQGRDRQRRHALRDVSQRCPLGTTIARRSHERTWNTIGGIESGGVKVLLRRRAVRAARAGSPTAVGAGPSRTARVRRGAVRVCSARPRAKSSKSSRAFRPRRSGAQCRSLLQQVPACCCNPARRMTRCSAMQHRWTHSATRTDSTMTSLASSSRSTCRHASLAGPAP